jgi:hypothetical protein
MTIVRILILSAFALGAVLTGSAHAQHGAPSGASHVAAVAAAMPNLSPVHCCDDDD